MGAKKGYLLFYVILVGASVAFLLIERLTGNEFMFHLAAIPMEVLIAVLIVERILLSRDKSEKRRQLMAVSLTLFSSETSDLFTASFQAMKSPRLSLSRIKSASKDELKKMSKDADSIEYESPELMEAVAIEYVKTRHIWQMFMDRALDYDIEETYRNMISVLGFINYVEVFKRDNPDKLFIREVMGNEQLMAKVKEVLGFAVRKFLDYAVELREKQPDVLNQLISELELYTQSGKPFSKEWLTS